MTDDDVKNYWQLNNIDCHLVADRYAGLYSNGQGSRQGYWLQITFLFYFAGMTAAGCGCLPCPLTANIEAVATFLSD
jgi:3'-phosphoadenosine 5'-phosphosulfate sulfotransferase (PAPS reductase)/FAD synthetase